MIYMIYMICPISETFCLCRYNKAQRLFEAGLENCADNPYLLQAFAVMEEGRGNQAKVSPFSGDTAEEQQKQGSPSGCSWLEIPGVSRAEF